MPRGEIDVKVGTELGGALIVQLRMPINIGQALVAELKAHNAIREVMGLRRDIGWDDTIADLEWEIGRELA